MTRPPLLPEPALAAAAAGRVDTAELRAGLAAAGLDAKLAPALAAEAVEHAERWRVEDDNRGTLTELRPADDRAAVPGRRRSTSAACTSWPSCSGRTGSAA